MDAPIGGVRPLPVGSAGKRPFQSKTCKIHHST